MSTQLTKTRNYSDITHGQMAMGKFKNAVSIWFYTLIIHLKLIKYR